MNTEDFSRLSTLNDEAYVQTVYRYVMGREADATGMENWLNAMAAGMAREMVFFGLRISEEGRRVNTPVSGFDIKEISLDQLLQYEGSLFIEAAYLSLIGRNADEGGMVTYLNAMAAGRWDKLDVIGILRDSAEGRKINVHVPGYERALAHKRRRARILGLPVFGRFIGTLWSLMHINRNVAAINQMRIQISQLQEMKKDDQAAQHMQMLQMHHQMQHRIDELTGHINYLGDRILVLNEELTWRRVQDKKQKHVEFNASYKRYEDKMRGSREEIKERLKIYDGVLTKIGIRERNGLVALDLGCGRGEWIELLQEEYNCFCIGVDSDASMLSACEALDLNTVCTDLLSYLKHAASESVDIISMFQVVEHMTYPVLQEVLSEINRVLRKDGMVILETPNPENLIVGTCNFYFDPTHVSKIPPALLEIFVKDAGMENTEVLRIHPYHAIDVEKKADTEAAGVEQMAAAFNHFADYAVVAYK